MSTVELKGITKTFGSLKALDAVSFHAKSGQIHALVGENGAGKTTLIRVLYGSLRADSGEILLGGKQQTIKTAADGISHGICMVSQHYAIIPELTCLQNLMLGAEAGWVISEKAAIKRADELAARMDFEFDWSAKAETLSPSSAQKLEILKLLWRNAKIMILDEPTAMLSPADSDALFDSLKKLASEGATIIVVTHRIPEVMQFCDHVTVLRAGKLVDEMPVSHTDATRLAEMIVGEGVDVPISAESEVGGASLVISGLNVLGARKDLAVKSVDLQLSSGEVLGIAGVDGSGQKELFKAILGTMKASGGRMEILGQEGRSLNTAARIKAGVRLIAEDRHSEAIIDDWSLELNAALGLQRLDALKSGLFVNSLARRELAAACADRFQTKHTGLDKPISSLSGGNQQRFVAARALSQDPKLILAFQPTRGLDINGAAQIYSAIKQECRENNAAALVVSFDLDELLEHCDRIVVMCHGELSEPEKGQEKDRQAIGRLMVGAK